MGNQTDRVTAGMRPQLNKTLENALSRRIAKEFPRIGGPRICSLTAVDRYLGQFDRVRHCSQQGLSTIETARILNCSVRLVEAYRQLDQQFEGKED